MRASLPTIHKHYLSTYNKYAFGMGFVHSVSFFSIVEGAEQNGIARRGEMCLPVLCITKKVLPRQHLFTFKNINYSAAFFASSNKAQTSSDGFFVRSETTTITIDEIINAGRSS